MATRTPVTIFLGALTNAAAGTSYTVPANSVLTISAATLNNATPTARTATVQVTPSGGSALGIVSALPVPAAGAAPTTLPGLVGQTLGAGGKIEALADVGAAVNIWVSGYLQQ
jgi:hypothetical protein